MTIVLLIQSIGNLLANLGQLKKLGWLQQVMLLGTTGVCASAEAG
jgi:hypothetical protein